MSMAKNAAIVSVSRIVNPCLMLLSPVILVRLLPISEFGRYREFLLHTTVLAECLAFAVSSSLLYFVPAYSTATWKFVRQCVLIVLAISAPVMLGILGLNHLLNGALLGEYDWYIAAYVLFYANLDFWEHLWLAQRRMSAVLAYSTGRVALRIALVVGVAWYTADVTSIVRCLVAFEALRAFVAFVAWRLVSKDPAHVEGGSLWRAQLHYCLPVGLALVLTSINNNIGALLVDHVLGHVSLAYFSVAAYTYLIINALRNSLSDVLLPEMVRIVERGGDAMVLWSRSIVIFTILLLPIAVILYRYAAIILPRIFTRDFIYAVPLFQLYLLTFLRECFDLDLALRALNRPRSLLPAQIVSFLTNVTCFALMVPTIGLVGAALSVVIARFVHGFYLLYRLQRLAGRHVGVLVPWKEFGKVLGATLTASVVMAPDSWTETFGAAGIVLSAGAYLVAFVCLLRLLHVQEANYVINLAARKALSRPA